MKSEDNMNEKRTSRICFWTSNKLNIMSNESEEDLQSNSVIIRDIVNNMLISFIRRRDKVCVSVLISRLFPQQKHFPRIFSPCTSNIARGGIAFLLRAYQAVKKCLVTFLFWFAQSAETTLLLWFVSLVSTVRIFSNLKVLCKV